MAPLAKELDVPMKGVPTHVNEYPVAAATKIYAGALVTIDAAGHAVAGVDTAAFICVGRAAKTIDNLLGLAGDVNVVVDQGVFKYTTTGASALVQADVGRLAYLLDDNNIVKAAGTTNSVIVGQVTDFDSDGVWVDTYKKTV